MTGDRAAFEGAEGVGQMETVTMSAVPDPTLTLPAVPDEAEPGGWDLTTQLPAVRVTGRDTITFPAIRGEEPEKCKCGTASCPDRDRGQDIPGPHDVRVVLSCGPGVVSKMWRQFVRDGRWENVRLLGANLLADSRKKTEAGAQRIRDDLDCGWHDVAAVFRADRALLSDGDLGAGLGWLAAEMASQLRDLHEMGYRTWVESGPASLARHQEVTP